MKMCQVCGSFAEDYEDYCPECGAPFPAEEKQSMSGLTLKEADPTYKVATNPMGTTISNGDGLTSVLVEGMEEDGYYGDIDGSFTSVNYQKLAFEDNDEKVKGKNKVGKTLFSVALIVLAIVGGYFFVTKVLIKKVGAESYQEAMDMYVTAVNDKDADTLKLIVPPYHNSPSQTANDYLAEYQGVTIKYKQKSIESLTKQKCNIVMDAIKLEYGKTVVPDEAYIVTATVKFTTDRAGRVTEKSEKVDYLVIKIKKRYYVYMDKFDFNQLNLAD